MTSRQTEYTEDETVSSLRISFLSHKTLIYTKCIQCVVGKSSIRV